ncbi:MAG: SpoIIE family protein phosphatase [Ignavibacteriales bacterium]|nr:SpoIIE family protein phosphatase [Ignavibacteriales bacterium]
MSDKIKKFWIKHRIKFVITSAVLMLMICGLNFIFIFSVTSQSNDECLWRPKLISKDSLAIFFDQVKVDGVTWQAGIRDGDQLIAIDGKKTRTLFVATQILDKVQKGDYATYTVKRNGEVFDTPVLVKKLINFQGLALTLLSTIWLVVSFVVVMTKPDGRTQRLFYKIGSAFVLYSIVNMLYRGSVVDNPIFQSNILLLSVENLIHLSGFFLPFMFVHFFSIFPKDFFYVGKKWFPAKLYLIPSVLFLITFALKVYLIYFKQRFAFYNFILNFASISIGIAMAIGLVLLFISYLKLNTKKERTPIFIILIAYLVGVLSLIYTNFIAAAFAGLIFNNPEFFMPIFLIALLPVAFGYSIFRYSLMDVSDVVKNTIIYGLATITLAGVYFLVIYVIGQSVGSVFSNDYQGIAAGVIFVIFAVIFQSTKDKFQDLLTEKFYPEQFAFQKSLLKFSGDVASIVGFENILDSTQQLFVKSLKLNYFGLMLNNGRDNTYQLVRGQGFYNPDMKIIDEDGSIEKYFLAQAGYGKKPFLERQDFKHAIDGKFTLLLDEEIFTIIPMVIKSKVIGLLLFGLKYSGSQFSGKDIDLLLSASGQTALSIENSRLYESEVEKKKLDRDLENARKIQESLLPKSFPKLKGLELFGAMTPAMQVGGDYYDLIQISDKKMFVVIGDVSGKGLSASFYMSKLQTMIRLYCTDDKSPKEILTEINKRIYQEIEKNWFITVTLALVDLEEKKIKISRAGHTPLIKLNQNLYESYQPSGVGIGLDRGEIFESSLEEEAIELNSGDLFFLFSDGVTELMNSEDELFGFDRLKKMLINNMDLNAELIGKKLLVMLEDFRGKTNQYDDVTFVILKIG